MSIKSERMRRLVGILQDANTWVSAPVLARMLGVTERTIRNYMAELACTHEVASSANGYRLEVRGASEGAVADAEAEVRISAVITRLLSALDPVSIFDLADELHVSESTVANSVLPAVRQLVARYDISLKSHDFALSLDGPEQGKRRLLGHLATANSYGYFSSTKTLAAMFPEFDTEAILNRLVEICQASELLLNNYALNNLLVHVLVIMIRLESNNELDNADDLIDVNALIAEVQQKDAILQCANRIARMFEEQFSLSIPERDFRQIILLIALSCDRYDYEHLDFENLSRLVDRGFLDDVLSIAAETSERYGLPPFDDDFLFQLTLHVFNAYQRALYGVGTKNPIGNQIRHRYAPIYDMSVYFVHQFEARYDVRLSEDEIAFIAYHMGAYLERHKEDEARLSCVVVVERYHGFSQELVDELERTLGDSLYVDTVLSYDEYLLAPVAADLTITTIELPEAPAHTVLVSPLVSRHDLRRVRSEVDDVEEERLSARARAFLEGLLRPELFLRNVELQSVAEYVDLMGALCLDEGVIGPEFVEDVKLRERVSSTAFVEGLALPHSINQFAEESFVCVVHNDVPIPWGRNSVNVVMMVGLTRSDMRQFRAAFAIIIERFSSAETLAKILRSDGFDEFVAALLG